MSHVKPYCLFLFFLMAISSFAQTDTNVVLHEPIDPNKKVKLFPKKYGEKRWKFLIGLDARRSWFAGKPIKINGLKIGAEHNGVHRFGLGIYRLSSKNAFYPEIQVSAPDAAPSPEVQFRLGYASLFYERVFLKTRWWEIAFPVHLGAGSITAYYRDTTQTYKQYIDRPFSALLASTQVKFYPISWLALRVSAGYRFNFNTTPEVKQTFNRPFYGYGLSVNILGLYRAIFPTKEERSIKKANRKEKGT